MATKCVQMKFYDIKNVTFYENPHEKEIIRVIFRVRD